MWIEPRWSLRGTRCKTSPPKLPPSSHSSNSRERPRRDKARRPEVAAKVGETGTSLPRRISLPKTSGRARRMRPPRGTHTVYAMVPIESLNALNGTSLSPLCKKKKRSKKRKEKSPHLSYLMPFKPRWRVNLVGACMWKPMSMVSHYKPC